MSVLRTPYAHRGGERDHPGHHPAVARTVPEDLDPVDDRHHPAGRRPGPASGGHHRPRRRREEALVLILTAEAGPRLVEPGACSCRAARGSATVAATGPSVLLVGGQ